MCNVLITGGSGGIATAIKKLLKEKTNYSIKSPGKDELDVTSYNKVSDYLRKAKVDILVNNAGYIEPGKVVQSDVGQWELHFKVNMLGTYYCTKEVLKNNPKALIVNIASTSGLSGRPNWSAYCASKAAVISFTQSLAEEGINAYSVSPGRTKTPMRKKLFPNEDTKTLMKTEEVASVVIGLILENKYNPGDNIIVRKNDITIQGKVNN